MTAGRARRAAEGGGSRALFAPALGVMALAMMVPMLHALSLGEERVARAFLYASIFSGFSAAILGIALASRTPGPKSQSELITLIAAWALLPAFAAIPLVILTPQIGWVGAWFEMVAAFTTTGSTVYQEPGRIDISIHLWRGIVGWLGGLMTLTAAFVILAPRRMGGFEAFVTPGSEAGAAQVAGIDVRLAELGAQMPPVASRVRRALKTILPVYGGITAALMMAFGMAGGVTITGVIHALGIVSTSGISPHAEGLAAEPSWTLEVIAVVGLIAAATSRVYGNASRVGTRARLVDDPELRLMALLVLAATALLMLRHWTAVLTLDNPGARESEGLAAFWGAFFTVVSYLTTTGYESASWQSAEAWAGLSNPTLILLGLCAIGGGAATTAGGMKLVRAAALLRHGVDEVAKIAQPNAVHGRGRGLGGGRGTLIGAGAFLGWAAIMLYTVTIFAVSLSLTLGGLDFQTAQIAAISVVSNTGPAFPAVAPGHSSFALMDTDQRVCLAIGMIAGRIETLALIAVMRRDAWIGLINGRKRGGKLGVKPPQSAR
ncbi:MAG: potassium transporter TrkG [Pseudomonadota bacterium]